MAESSDNVSRMIMGAQSNASWGGQSERPKCEECAISGGCLKWCVWGCPKWCGYIRMGSVRFISFSFSRNWMFGVSFRGSLRFGSVRRDDRFVSFRVVSHLFNIFSVSFRFRFTHRLWLQWVRSRKKYYMLESLRFRTIGKDSRFESL